MGLPCASYRVQRAVEAQEVALLSKSNPSTTNRKTELSPIARRPLALELYPDVIPPLLARRANFRRKSNILSVVVWTLVLPGLLATVVLPAYGAAAAPTRADTASIALQRDLDSNSQSVHVNATADISPALTRETFGVIPPVVVKPVVAVPTMRTLVSDPALPGFNLSSVVSVASQYLGVPYVFGGESPAGFDCSGLVAYVYAQFGIRLPHSSRLQGEIGTPIARSAALPGDVVVMDGGSHVGIYIGGGRYIDAPEPGRVVSNDLIYDNDYYIVRFGIG
jgi:cell wall-associated NlpC family hydrolase